MYTVKQKKIFTKPIKDGSIQTCYLMHITVDTIADIPDAKEAWIAGSRCDVLEDGGHVYMLSNGREWMKISIGQGNENSSITAADVKAELKKHDADLTAHEAQRHVIAERTRDPDKPGYGLGGGGETAVVLETSLTAGETEVSVIVSGTEYDAVNVSQNRETAEAGTLIINKQLEE